jgi:hypothetical protein
MRKKSYWKDEKEELKNKKKSLGLGHDDDVCILLKSLDYIFLYNL